MKNALESSGSDSRSSENLVPPELGEQRGDSRTISFVSPSVERSSEPSDQAEGSEVVNEADKTVISQRPVARPEEFFRSPPLAELASTLEGKQLDHFSVETMIGGGGMGAVFRGVDTRLDRVVAVKVIPASKRDADTLRRFRLEAQAAARLDHPNIARVYYVGEAEQWNYIVFEFIDGINIRDLVEMEGPLSIDDAVFYARQVAEALQHAHERDVVHRDVKPSNVLVTAQGIAKLVDMGLARDTSLDKSTADATASGVTLGTFDYISPEQARNPRDADVRSDLYSLGCTLFYMLTGSPPFPEGTALQKLLNHGSLPPPDPRAWRADVSDQLVEVLMKLMAKRPADRYQKPAELVNDLLLLAEIENLPRSQGPTTLMLSPSIAQRSLLEANLPWIVACVFLLGSGLWLQSVQSMPNGFNLQALKFDPKLAEDRSLSQAAPTPSQESSDVAGDAARDAPQRGAESVPTESPPPVVEDDSPAAGTSEPENSAVPFERPKLDAVESNASAGTGAESGKPTTSVPTVFNPAAAVNGSALGASTSSPRSLLTTDSSAANSSLSGSSVLVVAKLRPASVPVEQWEPSLSRALTRLSGRAAVIEIQGTVLVDRPLVLDGQDIQLQSASAGRGVIEFDPEIAAGAESSASITVRNGKLKLKGLAVNTSLPAKATTPAKLFRVHGNSSVDFEDCVVSVQGDYQGQCSIFELSGEQELASAPVDASETTAAPSMELTFKNSRFRGASSLLHVDERNTLTRSRLGISFENCLIAIDGIALGLDARTGEAGTGRLIRLFCKESTFVTAEGFAVLRYEGGGQPLVGLSRTSQGCVFWSRPDVPHIAIHGESAGLLENPNLLLLQGFDNAYDENIQYICQTFSDGSAIFDLDIADGQQEGWFSERSIERGVRWTQSVLLAQPFARSRADDFALNQAMFVPGFKSELLPPPNVE